ncbi:sugar phosphate isomerase/epimerase family protein [Aurantiacibacter spongiae]|uniref:Sugar phosphate isomerase/epimerase n=1 Tax=Aurantiacibacter spongiae TaxID=2488860 RepID=A0A3N5D9A7_9SPHN|nr:sugar phosphate isomerase/epimerase family protein [Aurantiacibacter spongiae]RPF71188.1 sugar phosphate isomerase/epimerase [Aurantiacibacter spongiae]
MTLRYAYNTNGAANHRLDDALRLIADSGYAGAAITLDHHHCDPLAPGWRAEAERVARLLSELGLGAVVETGARFLLDPRSKHEPTLISPEPEGRERRIGFLTRALDIAAIWRADAVSFWAGVPRPGTGREDAMEWLHEGLARVLDHAEAIGVDAAFEPEPGMLIETCGEWADLRARHPRLKLALDTGHCLVSGDIDPADAVRRHADHLGTVAIEDMATGVHVHLPFGEGDMDIPAVLAALSDIGFERLVSVELSRESPRAHEAIPESIAYLKDHEPA